MFFIISQVFAIRSQMIDIRIIELLGSSNTKYFLPFGCIQEFSMLIQQFQCIPLFGVMWCSQNDTATSPFHCNSQFGCRSRSKIDINYVPAHTHQGTDYDILYHLTGNAGITAHYYLVTFWFACFANQSGISRREFYNVKRVQSFACASANGSTDTRDRFD